MNSSIDLYQDLKSYIIKTSSDFDLDQAGGAYFSMANTGKRGGGKKWFNIGLVEILQTLEDVEKNLEAFLPCTRYNEQEWRDLGGTHFSNEVASSLVTVQTKPFFTMLSKLLNWASETPSSKYSDDSMPLTAATLETTIRKLKTMSEGLTPEYIASMTLNSPPPERQQGTSDTISIKALDEAFEAAAIRTGFYFSTN
jgi:hypothetical protein